MYSIENNSNIGSISIAKIKNPRGEQQSNIMPPFASPCLRPFYNSTEVLKNNKKWKSNQIMRGKTNSINYEKSQTIQICCLLELWLDR